MSSLVPNTSTRGKELIQRTRELAQTLLRTYEKGETIASRRRQIERFYTHECSLIHPLFKLFSSHSVSNLFALWALVNLYLKPEIREIYISKQEDEVFVDLVHHFQLIPWLMLWPRGFRMGVRLVWVQDPTGNFRVSHHEDSYRLDVVLDFVSFGLYSSALRPLWSCLTMWILIAFEWISSVASREPNSST